MKIGPTLQFILIGVAVGVVLPFVLAVCLFSTTLQGMVAGPVPTPGFWSGAPTPVASAAPNPVRVWTGDAFAAGGGTVFVLWSVLGAFAGEAIAVRRVEDAWERTRRAWLGAVAGSVILMALALCAFMR